MDTNSSLISELYSKQVIDVRDKEYLEGLLVRIERNQKLLSIMEEKSLEEFDIFRKALVATNQSRVDDILNAIEG